MGRFTRMLVLASLTLGGLTTNACWFNNDDDEREERDAHGIECDTDDQCAHLDDGDSCYGAPYCEVVVVDHISRCSRDFLQDEDTCQCVSGRGCEAIPGFEQHACNVLTCDNHLCGNEIAAAGEADERQQIDGDCGLIICDGETVEGSVEEDLSDLPDDNDLCTVDQCTDTGPENVAIGHGEVCSDGSGHCYQGSCFAGCIPDDPVSCGGEGVGEPSNGDGTTAISLAEHTEVCGMLDAQDFDWYEMNLVDEDFKTDIFELTVHSSASTLEVCAFMDCNGTNNVLGGCSTHLGGPHNSLGCCWRAAPENIRPVWDIDCANQTDDGGTMYIAVSAPDGDTCETYTLSAHY